jgi:hypothetical protein
MMPSVRRIRAARLWGGLSPPRPLRPIAPGRQQVCRARRPDCDHDLGCSRAFKRSASTCARASESYSHDGLTGTKGPPSTEQTTIQPRSPGSLRFRLISTRRTSYLLMPRVWPGQGPPARPWGAWGRVSGRAGHASAVSYGGGDLPAGGVGDGRSTAGGLVGFAGRLG